MFRKIIFSGYVISGVRVLASTSVDKAPAMAPLRNQCVKAEGGIQCRSGPSTLIIVVAGMCTMMLLVVVAILLLCFSHFRYRQRLRTLQQLRYPHENMSREATTTTPSFYNEASSTLDTVSSSTNSDGIVLVLLPGDHQAFSCAKPCPLFPLGQSNTCSPAFDEGNIKDKSCN